MRRLNNKYIRNFEQFLRENEKSCNTIGKYMRDIRFFSEWLKDNSVDKQRVIEYKGKLCKEYAPKSVNSMLSSLNSLFAFLGWNELKVKTLKIQQQLFVSQEKELSKAEYEKLLGAAKRKNNDKMYYLMQTICSTGLRISELEYITCDAIEREQAVINCKGKIRRVILPKKLCEILKCYMMKNNIKCGPVFITKNGKPLERSAVWKMLKNLCKIAGVSPEKVFPHNFRHLFARTFYSQRKDIVRLADVLGHTSINTTRIYTAETGENHRKQLQMLGLLEH